MKTIRICLYSSLLLFIATFLVGTFCDLSINQALFSNLDTFGLTVSVIGKIPGYAMYALLSGGLIAYALRKDDYKLWYRIMFFIVGFASFITVSIIQGLEFFGPNGFYWVASKGWGCFISFPVLGAFVYLGYRMFRHNENKNLWILFLVLIIAMTIALVGGITLIKEIFHRPRYRSVFNAGVDYYPWYIRCGNYKDLMKTHSLISEEFKSFPSGHSGTSLCFALCALFLPFVDQKYKKLQLPLFIVGLLFAMLVMFCRMLVGAHYLSDVSMGAILPIVVTLLALLAIRKTNKFSI